MEKIANKFITMPSSMLPLEIPRSVRYSVLDPVECQKSTIIRTKKEKTE